MIEPGIVRVDKPAGPTSHDVVAAARRAFGERRIGHTGTLDPFATGLLLVCVGREATRLAPLLTVLPKRYRAVARLGEETTTDDGTGEVTQRSATDHLEATQVTGAFVAMTGEIMQTPPAFSAKKVEGRRAYKAARAGAEMDLAPVRVTIHEMIVHRVALPEVEFEVECSSGTYVRAIARDVGRTLGVGGHLRSLRRTAIGRHSVDGAVSVEQLGDADAVRAAWMSPLDAVRHLPVIAADEAAVARILHGMSIDAPGHTAGAQVAVASGDRLIAIGEVLGDTVLPKKVLA